MTGLQRLLGRAALLTTLLLLAACAPRESTVPVKDAKPTEEDPPPHGGKLFAVPGHKYHGELLLVEKDRQATFYLYDGQVRNAVPTKAETFTLTIKDAAPLQITLKPERQEKDPPGTTSRFVGTHERLGSPLDCEKVELTGLVEGKPYVFTLDKE